jgi:hypothetical protein
MGVPRGRTDEFRAVVGCVPAEIAACRSTPMPLGVRAEIDAEAVT